MNFREDTWKRVLCYGLLVLLCFVAFSPVFMAGKIIAPIDIQESFIAPWSNDANGDKPYNQNPSDAVTQYLPYRMFAERSFAEDGYLGWNPYSMGGSSLAGNTMALPGSWTTQLHRFMSFPWAWNCGIVAEFLIAGIGMLTFLRSRKLPWLICLFGAIAYMGNSQFLIWINHRWTLGSFCWMPLVLWAASAGFDWRKLSFRQLLLPVFLCLALIGGSLQHMLFVVLACGFFMLGSWTSLNPLKNDWSLAIKWTSAFLFSFAIIAFTLVPQVSAYMTNIEIGHKRGAVGYPEGVFQPLLNLVAIPAQIWPWLMGAPQTIDGSKLLKLGYMNISYFGTIPMVLSIIGLFRKSMPREAKWLMAAGLLIPITPLVGPLYHRVQLLFILGGTWMASEMLAHYCQNSPKQLAKYLSMFILSVGLGLVAGSLLTDTIRLAMEDEVVAQSLAVADSLQFGQDKDWIENRARAWTDRFTIHNQSTMWVYILLIFGGLGIFLISMKKRGIGLFVLLLAVVCESGTFLKTSITFAESSKLKPGHASIDELTLLAGDNLVLQGFGKVPIVDVFAAPNVLSSYMVKTLDAYESIQYKSIFVSTKDLNYEDRYTLSGVGISIQHRSLTPYDGTDKWPVVASLGQFDVRENPNKLATLISIDSMPKSVDVLGVLKSGEPLHSQLATMNRRVFTVPNTCKWVRVGCNWHRGWMWRAEGGRWNRLIEGSDGASWLNCENMKGGRIELKFNPRPRWSVISTAVCLSLLLVLAVFLGVRRLKNT